MDLHMRRRCFFYYVDWSILSIKEAGHRDWVSIAPRAITSYIYIANASHAVLWFSQIIKVGHHVCRGMSIDVFYVVLSGFRGSLIASNSCQTLYLSYICAPSSTQIYVYEVLPIYSVVFIKKYRWMHILCFVLWVRWSRSNNVYG